MGAEERSKQSYLSPFGCEVDWIGRAHLHSLRPKAKVHGSATQSGSDTLKA